MDFCAAILMLKMEEDTQHFWCIMLSYFKKGKNATDAKKDFCNMEKVLWLTECVTSGLQTFLVTIDILAK